MQPGQYPTSGDVRVLINGKIVDDSLRISYEEQNRKTPLWGYHQKYTGAVADGKVIITGTLAIHFRFPGYLMYAIKTAMDAERLAEANRKLIAEGTTNPAAGTVGSATNTPPADYETKGGAGLISVANTIQRLRRMSPSQRAQAILESGSQFNRYSDLLTAMFAERAQGSDEKVGNPVTESPSAFTGVEGGFDIDIVYAKTDTPGTLGSFYAREKLVGVHLTGSRKVINAGLGGGDLGGSGQSLVEVYPFLAKKVVRYSLHESDRDSTQVGSGGSSPPGLVNPDALMGDVF